ncbi:Uncharacterized protein BW664_01061 [Bacillus mycoides]|nr:Uncharacterized protein BW664_01061 [Bacillus mycoides]
MIGLIIAFLVWVVISLVLDRREQTVVVYTFDKIVENGIAVFKKFNEK